MKNLKHALILSIALISLIACNKDDEKSTTELNKERLIGSWKFVSSSTNDVVDPLEDCENLETLVFTSTKVTNTFFFGENCAQTNSISNDYTVNENKITVVFPDENYTTEITRIDGTSLVLKDQSQNEVYLSTYIKQ